MPIRQPSEIPKIWLMTDPRLGDRLLAAICRLPTGSGVVFRHYELPAKERRRLFEKVRRICRLRGHRLLLAGGDPWPADGVHGRHASKNGLLSMPVHNVREIAVARRSGADILFLSPLCATRSHPGARPLGLTRFGKLAQLAHPARVIALGGMTQNRARAIKPHIAHGWAAIDAFI